MRRLAGIAALLALAGCMTWTHPTKTAQNWDQDLYECQRDAAAVRDGWAARDMQERCMRLKGWQR